MPAYRQVIYGLTAVWLVLAAAIPAGNAVAQPCYGSLGATQTERRAAAADRDRANYVNRDRRYSGANESSLRMQMRQRGCNDRGKARSIECQRLTGRLSAMQRQTTAYSRTGVALDRSARYHDRRARTFADDYTRCGGSLRP